MLLPNSCRVSEITDRYKTEEILSGVTLGSAVVAVSMLGYEVTNRESKYLLAVVTSPFLFEKSQSSGV